MLLLVELLHLLRLAALLLRGLLLQLGRLLVRLSLRFLGIALRLLRLDGLGLQPGLRIRELLLLLGHFLLELLDLRLLVGRALLRFRGALQGLVCLLLHGQRLRLLGLLLAPAEHRTAERKREARKPHRVSPHEDPR